MAGVMIDLEFEKENAEAPKASLNAVCSNLLAINRNVSNDVLKQASPDLLAVINELLTERQALASQVGTLKKEKEASNNALQVLKNDITVCNTKYSAMCNESRQLRMQWLAEKNDLEARVFQTVSLNTQLQGTLRKKEKDFEKLQNQLLKLVKDTSRAKPMITLSKPLQKNSSQIKSGTIKDAELEAYISTNQSLEKENSVLRSNIDKLKQTMQDLKQQFDHNVDIVEKARQKDQEHIRQLRNQLLEIEKNQLHVDMKHDEPVVVVEESSTREVISTPDARRKGPSNTESDSTIDWVITEANTEIKRLRNRSETIIQSQSINESDRLQAQLLEALNIIKEQDRLIHCALVGALPKTKDISAVTAVSDIQADIETECDSPAEDRAYYEVPTHGDASLSPLILCLNDDEFPCENGITPNTIKAVKAWFK
jgi:predicted nuclease with TOPRIM domain